MSLEQLLDRYAVSRGIGLSTIEYYRRCLNVYRSSGGAELSLAAINQFLWNKAGSPHYRKSLRTALVSLARFAESIGESTDRVTAIAPVRVSQRPVKSWSSDEVSRLRVCALKLRGHFKSTCQSRSIYFHSMIGAAWYLGVSQIDLHRLTLSDFVDGNLVVNRQKTGATVRVGLPPDEWTAAQRLAVDGHIWPQWGSREIFARTFARIVATAGLSGPWKTLRASAGTAYEIAHPGMGHIFLGNTRDVFMRSYYDPRREPGVLPHAPLLP